MSRTDHRCNRSFAISRVRPLGGERTNSPPLGEAKGRRDGRFLGSIQRFPTVRLADPGMPELLGKPSLPIASAGKRARLDERECGIIDIAELCKPFGKRLEIRIAHPVPASLAQLP